MPHDRMLATREHLHLDQQVHLPRRLPALGRGDRRDHPPRTPACGSPTGWRWAPHYAETLRRWDEAFLAAADEVRDARLRRDLPAGCGTSTSSTPAPASPPATSTSTSSRSPDRRTCDDHGLDSSTTGTGAADRLAEAVRPFIGGDLPVRLRAWDGSEAGPADAPLVELRSPDAVRRLLWRPGELGAAQAYVTGELEVPRRRRDLDAALTHAFSVARERGLSGGRPSPAALAQAVRTAVGIGAAPIGGAHPLPRPPRRGSAAGCTARCATGARSATTTTSPTSSTR